MTLGLPHVRSLVVVEKTSTTNSTSAGPCETTAFYLSSHHPRRAKYFAELIRGHWGGCEIRNHWVRDAIFEEDATRSKNFNLNGNLAILRSCLIALKVALVPESSWPYLREISSSKPSIPYNLVCKHKFK